jgi:DNA-binding NarL/FixJ family response regulator
MVLAFAARGLSNKEIARQLGITERTVKDHWSCIFEQMDVTNRAEAVSRAHELRLI